MLLLLLFRPARRFILGAVGWGLLAEGLGGLGAWLPVALFGVWLGFRLLKARLENPPHRHVGDPRHRPHVRGRVTREERIRQLERDAGLVWDGDTLLDGYGPYDPKGTVVHL